MTAGGPDWAGRRVLLHSIGPRAGETVTALALAGARVAVRRAEANAPMHDLHSRGLLDLVETDLTTAAAEYDVVMRDPRAVAHPETPAPQAESSVGRVTLVGGGPGADGLLTIAGLQALQDADVVVTDRLAPLGVLAGLPATTQVVHVGKIPRGEFTPQEAINALLVEHALAGKHVVRLKGGDNFVFGRGGEEWNDCVAAGVPVGVIPGVSSSIAAPALAGIPLTHRSLTQGFAVVSAHVGPDDPRSTVDWAALAHSGLTIVVLMGVATIGAVADALVAAGLAPDTPAAMIADGGLPTQRSVRATLHDLARVAAAEGLGAPAVSVIGPVVDALDQQ